MRAAESCIVSNIAGIGVGSLIYYGGQYIGASIRIIIENGGGLLKPTYGFKTSLLLATGFVAVNFFVNFGGHYFDSKLGSSPLVPLKDRLTKPSCTGLIGAMMMSFIYHAFLPNPLRSNIWSTIIPMVSAAFIPLTVPMVAALTRDTR